MIRLFFALLVLCFLKEAIISDAAFSQEKRATRESFACNTVDQFVAGAKMLINNDYASLKAYITDMSAIGECAVINKGNRLFLDEVNAAGVACVRVRAERKCRWTIQESYN